MWIYANTAAWALVGFILMFVFVPSREITSWINIAGLLIMISSVARLAYLYGTRSNPKPPDIA